MRSIYDEHKQDEEEKEDSRTMYKQDFERLKAQFCNNMAACYQKMGDIEQADTYNNWALVECPDYAKALHRKCLIHEAKREYTMAVKIAEFCAKRFDHEDEPEDNRQTVGPFNDLADRCRPRIPYEAKETQDRLKAEADAEFDEVFEKDQDLVKMNELLGQCFEGLDLGASDDEEDGKDGKKGGESKDATFLTSSK